MRNFPSWLARQVPALASVMLRGFIVLAPAIPMTAAALTVILYVALNEPAWAAFVYTSAAILPGVAIGSVLVGPFTTFERANRTTYGGFQVSYTALQNRLASIPPTGQASVGYKNASAYRDALVTQMMYPRSTRWILGVGYINLLRTLHRAEESLITADWPDEALKQAQREQRDELSIKGSTIPGRSDLLKKLRTAVGVLRATDVAKANTQLSSNEPDDQATGRSTLQKLADAQITVAEVRRALNEYRDSRWDGLVRARNALNARTFITGLVAYALVAVVLLEEVDSAKIAAGAVYCGVGAIAGFFNRVFADQRTERTIEDYGLSTARLFRTALFSALAGVGGVVIIAMLPAALNDLAGDDSATSVAVPSPTGATNANAASDDATATDETTAAEETPAAREASVPSASVDPTYPSLSSIFDLGANPFRIALAAIFGLTPELLLVIIRQQGEQLKAQLKSTEPGEAEPDTDED